MVILGMPSNKNGGSRRNRREEEEHDEEMIESEEMEYSDEQLGMAGELRSALDSGSDHDVVSAIHGIMMSYQDYE